MERVLAESQGVALANEWTRPDANGTLPLRSHGSIASWSISPLNNQLNDQRCSDSEISLMLPKQ